MAILQIPTDSDNSTYTETIQLEGIFYIFDFHWNTRDEAWYCTIYASDRTPIIAGIKLVVDYELLNDYKVEGMPPGALFLIDTTLQRIPCQRNDLGVRCQLIYLTSDEL
jgi:hypothetical protein